MTNKKLVISSKKFRGDSSVVSVRLPNELIDQIDTVAEQTGRTRNEIIQKCLAFSIEGVFRHLFFPYPYFFLILYFFWDCNEVQTCGLRALK